MILTQSEMQTWLSDRRRWYLSHYLKRRPRHDYAYIPSVGTFYHAGLESYYRGNTDPLAIVQSKVEALIAQDLPEDKINDLIKAAELAGIMIEGYLDWCPAEDAHMRILSAEEKVEIPLKPSPFILRGKIDARALDERTDAVVQLEHKTVQSLDDLPKYAQSNFQFLTYDLLAYLSDDQRTDGVLLNMAKRVKRTKTAKPPFYGRHEVRHNVQELRAHWKHIVTIGEEIAKTTEALDNGADHHRICPPHVTRDSAWSNSFLPLYRVMDDGGDWKGMLNDLYEEYDPLERYDDVA